MASIDVLNTKDVWKSVLDEAEQSLSRASFHTWFRKTELASLHDGVATIHVPNEFSKEWMETKYRHLLLKFLRNTTQEIRDIVFVIHNEQKTKDGRATRNVPDTHTIPLPLTAPRINRETNLNPRYTLDAFVVGPSNELVHAAATAVTRQLATLYNPLFVWGGTGLGKTHLLHAIGNAIVKENNLLKVRYVTSEKFTSDFVTALRTRTIETFRERYRSYDVLLIDDVQFLGGKEKSQEELFHTFNELYSQQRQLVFASDRPPRSIPELEERLRSRFEGGMIADIQPPDFETRLAIIYNKAKERGCVLDEETARAIAEIVQRNIRELEGALNRAIAETKNNSIRLSVRQVRRILANTGENQKKTTFKDIVRCVSRYYDLEETVLFDKTRRQEVVRPRQIAMYLSREMLKLSFPSIGVKFSGRDHTTIMHACTRIREEITSSGHVVEELQAIHAILREHEEAGETM